MGSFEIEDARALIRKMDEALAPVFRASVIPIFAEDKTGMAVQCGTGTLFRVADTSFLVTASHVLDIRNNKLDLMIAGNSPGSHNVILAGRYHQLPKPYDVSVVELDPRVVENLKGQTFLTVHQADRTKSRVGPGWFYINGFPSSLSKFKPYVDKFEVTRFNYGGVLYGGDTEHLDKYDPEIHCLLSIPAEGNVDSDGDPAELPANLCGISGCSIWQAFSDEMDPASWHASDVSVIAVQTGVYEKARAIKGTYWFVVSKILRSCRPDLGPCLDLQIPVANSKRLYLPS